MNEETPVERPRTVRRAIHRIGGRHTVRIVVILVAWITCVIVFLFGESEAAARVEAAWILCSAALYDAIDEGARRVGGRRRDDP